MQGPESNMCHRQIRNSVWIFFDWFIMKRLGKYIQIPVHIEATYLAFYRKRFCPWPDGGKSKSWVGDDFSSLPNGVGRVLQDLKAVGGMLGREILSLHCLHTLKKASLICWLSQHINECLTLEQSQAFYTCHHLLSMHGQRCWTRAFSWDFIFLAFSFAALLPSGLLPEFPPELPCSSWSFPVSLSTRFVPSVVMLSSGLYRRDHLHPLPAFVFHFP